MVKVTHRIRYPPFESQKLNPEHIPIVEHSFEIEDSAIPAFRLGSENSWIVERVVDGEHDVDIKYHGEEPQIVQKQRRGWFLVPHPFHGKARYIINITVAILLTCLFYLFTTPVQSALGIPVYGTGKIRLGLLDYPLLAVVVVPLMLTPIAMRVTANLGDLRRQKSFFADTPKSPQIDLESVKSGGPLKGNITLKDVPEDWQDLSVFWRVGILPPARHKVFSALGRDLDGQPPPGLSTALPHHWEKGLDDGTGMGEDAPMQRHDVPGGVYLRPMRIMASGGREELGLEGGKFQLSPPEGEWPGTIYGDLVRVHWELVIKIGRKDDSPILWVEPLTVDHHENPIENSELIISDGRSESDTI